MTFEPERCSPVLEVNELRQRYRKREVLADVSFVLQRGHSAVITGRSGSGKTTLLSCILGLIKPSSGTITVAGSDVTAMGRAALARYRRSHIGMVFQGAELMAELSAVENVAIAALLAGHDATRARSMSVALLEALAVPVASTPASDLSGGERQRTALARALINKPPLILADEPTGSLDAELREDAADRLFSIPAAGECALVVVTHDPAIASRADAHYVLSGGALTARPTRAQPARVGPE